MALRRLEEIGRSYGTDKSSLGHGYLDFYERFLRQLRFSEVRLLELGVQGGPSLRMWKEYFERGHIVGMDIDPACAKWAEDRIEICIGDAGAPKDLLEVNEAFGPFDIINDDASHLPSDQITAFSTLFPYLKFGGYYILEDVVTDYAATFCAGIVEETLRCRESVWPIAWGAFIGKSFIAKRAG